MTAQISGAPGNTQIIERMIIDAVENSGKAIRKALFEIGAESTRMAKGFVINPPKTGRIYHDNSKRPKWHQASAPGQSPAKWTGNLNRNIVSIVTGSEKVEIGVTVLYGKFLEEGTTIQGGNPRWSTAGRSGGRMRNAKRGGMLPRPYLIRTVNSMKRRNMAIIERHLKDQVQA